MEAVFFDAMGTLIYLPQPVGHHYSLVARRHGLAVGEEAVERAFRSAWKQMPGRPVTKMPRPDDDKGWWRDLVSRVFATTSPGQVVSGECFEEIYSHFAQPGIWQLYPEAADVLAALARENRLGVISNFDRRLNAILAGLGVLDLFETVILSSETGADKPAPYIFEHALDEMGVSACDALHVGDDPVRDWEAAAAVGMHVYKLERPGNSLAGLLDLLAIF